MHGAETEKNARRFKGLSSEERKEARRKQLLEAGLRAFGTHGFHAVGVREICAEAHLTERYFYESFANREALFLAVYEQGVARIREAILAAIERTASDPDAMARAALRAFFETLRDEPRLARVVLLDVLSVGADVGAQSIRVTETFADVVVGLIEGRFPDLEKHGLDSKQLANGLVGASLFMAMHWSFNGFKEPLEEVLRHCVLIHESVGQEVARLAEGG